MIVYYDNGQMELSSILNTVLALGNTSLNNISQKSLVEDTSKTSVYLKNLIELGIVEREFPADTKVKKQANGNRGTYRLTDNFFRFWYAFRYAKMGRWTGNTTVRDNKAENELRMANMEIDLLAIDRSGKEFLVGECKFKKEAFTYGEYLDTLAKLTPLKEKAKFHYALFSENGFDDKIISDAEKDGTTLYDLEQIVENN